MKKNKPFKFPKALLSQINECSSGYLLVTINERGDFEVYPNLTTTEQKFAMANFVEYLGTMLQKGIHEKNSEDPSEDEEE